MNQPSELRIATYHYVRDLPRTRFPRIKGMLADDFRAQVTELAAVYEVATLESALAYLHGQYRPSRHLCLLTFDDGLREHYTTVAPLLAEAGIQGVFFLITSCLEDRRVAPVHMNHFLMAALGFEKYATAFRARLKEMDGSGAGHLVDKTVACRTYPWDTAPVAEFKYLVNFTLPASLSNRVLAGLFETYLGGEAAFASELYVSWREARAMQSAGMIVGGHSHRHRPLASLGEEELGCDLASCRALLARNLRDQDLWPFSYPYGKRDSYSGLVIQLLRDLGFCCALCTETGRNLPGDDLFAIRRLDCKQILPAAVGAA